jgi:hypothetical protein
MHVGAVAKWLAVAIIVSTCTSIVAACGISSSGTSNIDASISTSEGGGNGLDGGGGDGPRSLRVEAGRGGGADGCAPKTCKELGFTCGQWPTCGAIVNCNGNGSTSAPDCPEGEVCTSHGTCAGGGPSGKDGGGDAGVCTPETCTELGYGCGLAVSCGQILNCNSNGSTSSADCPAGEVCGAGGQPNRCVGASQSGDGGASCKPTTCQALGFSCGLTSDGCNGVLNCNANGSTTTPACSSGESCVNGTCGGAGSTTACDAGTSTTIKGYVYDPADHLPVYNALVYVPAGAVQTPTSGITVPGTCGCTVAPAFASTFTAVDGSFTLTGVPAGATTTLVVELGKWQRVYPGVAAPSCKTTTLSAHLNLPSSRSEGNIPRFAVDTGAVDAMECVLPKMGISSGEFADPAISGGVPTAAQRIHFYKGGEYTSVDGGAVAGSAVGGGAVIDSQTPSESALVGTSTVLDSYDAVLFACQGQAGNYSQTDLTNLGTYANNGGRFFATHFHYDLLYGNISGNDEGQGPFVGTASWNTPLTVEHDGLYGFFYSDTEFTSSIEQSFPVGAVLAQWLYNAYGGTSGEIPVGVIRNDFTSVNAPSQLWMYTDDDTSETWTFEGHTVPGPAANLPIHYTFDTPFNQTPTCGRGVFSDFHVESYPSFNGFGGDKFPNECPGGTSPSSMTPQEALLEFMLLDLTSCVSPPVCTPLTCASYPTGTCGEQSNGCGGLTTNCGTCEAPATCGGGGVANRCGSPSSDAGTCVPLTCGEQNIACGPAGNGCGGLITNGCGSCPTGKSCVNGQCYGADAGPPPTCMPETCAAQGIQCGPAGNGCGEIIQCPACPSSETCSASGQCIASAK